MFILQEGQLLLFTVHTPRGILPMNSNFSKPESYKILQAPTATTV